MSCVSRTWHHCLDLSPYRVCELVGGDHAGSLRTSRKIHNTAGRSGSRPTRKERRLASKATACALLIWFTCRLSYFSSPSCVSRFWFLHIQMAESNLRKCFTQSVCGHPETSGGRWQAPASDSERPSANPESSAVSKGRKLQSNSTGSPRCHLGLHGSNLQSGTLLAWMISPACSSASFRTRKKITTI